MWDWFAGGVAAAAGRMEVMNEVEEGTGVLKIRWRSI